MAFKAATEERYATQVGALWSGLTHTLLELEALAADPERLDDEEQLALLRRLQYALHRSSEHAFGLAPPEGTEPVHAELAAALAEARDATSVIAQGIEGGGFEAVQPLVYRWRGALFSVRLARQRLARSAQLIADPEPAARRGLKAPLAALALVVSGTAMFVVGATATLWPLWVAGLVAFSGSVLALRR